MTCQLEQVPPVVENIDAAVIEANFVALLHRDALEFGAKPLRDHRGISLVVAHVGAGDEVRGDARFGAGRRKVQQRQSCQSQSASKTRTSMG